MRVLFYGDIVGKVGRFAVHFSLAKLVQKYHVDFVIANAENATHGKGLSESHYRYLLSSGVDAMSLGNHWNGTKDIGDYIDDAEELVRPLNLLHFSHGTGSASFDVNGVEIRLTNILGQAFMKEEVASPYLSLKELLPTINPCIHIVDFHADSTSEKAIFAYCFDGQISAVIGTHTHVQSADERILPNGTAFLTDVGMCGDPEGIIGYEKNSVINKMVFGAKEPFQINDAAPMMVNAVVMEFSDDTYQAISITRVNERVEA